MGLTIMQILVAFPRLFWDFTAFLLHYFTCYVTIIASMLTWKKILLLLLLLLFTTSIGATEKGLIVKGVRHSTYTTFTRIVFEVEVAAPYVLTRSQDGRSIMLGSYEGPLVLKTPLPMIHDSVVAGMEPWEEAGRTYAVIRLEASAGQVKDFTLRGPDRIVLDITKTVTAPIPVPTAGNPSVIVLDPGHGGEDTGLLMSQGIEKNFDLELALAVKKRLLQQKPSHFRVILTRDRDLELTLDERAALANAANVTIFVSIHGAPADGTRVYIQDLVNETGVSTVQNYPENRDFLGFESESEKRDMIWGSQQAVHANQSVILGRKIASLLTGNGSAEPVQVPLAGLKAIDAAAVMVEIGMGQDRSRAVESIAGGIKQYVMDNR
jgi:N-acetylmuramoyl-L-alanine amidase